MTVKLVQIATNLWVRPDRVAFVQADSAATVQVRYDNGVYSVVAAREGMTANETAAAIAQELGEA